MRTTLLCLLALGFGLAPASRAGDGLKAAANRRKVELRVFELQPRRRDAPLRYVNLTDDEVREIQRVAANHIPKVLLNISPVVTGCPCEEGPQCTEQVYVLAGVNEPQGLQLSRVKNSWQV